MKKKLAALMCGVMCVTAFTGCSSTELAYLKMGSDLLDTMSSCVAEGTMQADIDFDALNVMQKDVAKATGVENDGVDTGLNGKKSLKVDYEMNMNIDRMEYDMAFDVTYGGKTYDLGRLYYSLDKGIYVTSDTLWGIYQVAGSVMDGYEDHYVMSDAFAKDFKAVLAEDKYIELVSVEQLTGVDMDEVVPEQNMAELYDAVFTFYEDVLDGFESGMVKEINGGYQIEADGREVAQLLADLLHFVADNPDQVIDATEAYMAAVMDNMAAGTPEETAAAKEAMAELFAAARASQNDFVVAAEQMAYMVEGMMQDAGVGMLLDSFDYVGTVKKAGDGFNSVAAYTVKHKGKTVCSLVTDSVMKKADAKVVFPTDGMTVDELETKMTALENKYNPVTGVSMTWGWEPEPEGNEATLYAVRAEEPLFGGGITWTDITIKDGRAYLPLRVVAEALGENVGWENSTKTPYVMQGGQRIDMKGMLQADKAFVGVRDFEKLGYTVTFTNHGDGLKEVMIEK